MNPTRRLLLTVVLPLTVAGLVAFVAFAPGEVEGVYLPFSSFGCQGDQFIRIRDGRGVMYAMCDKKAYLDMFYEMNPSGSPVFRLSTDRPGEIGKPFMRAEPHLLGTRFFYLNEGTSEWKWKRILTRKMREHMKMYTIQELEHEKDRMKITTSNSQLKVLNTIFRPVRKSSPATTPAP